MHFLKNNIWKRYRLFRAKKLKQNVDLYMCICICMRLIQFPPQIKLMKTIDKLINPDESMKLLKVQAKYTPCAVNGVLSFIVIDLKSGDHCCVWNKSVLVMKYGNISWWWFHFCFDIWNHQSDILCIHTKKNWNVAFRHLKELLKQSFNYCVSYYF